MQLFFLLTAIGLVLGRYQPTWDSIDSRPLPDWYDDAKFGIFMHWGAYAVPAYRGVFYLPFLFICCGKMLNDFRSEWFWWYWQGPTPDKGTVDWVNRNYPPGWTYADFARDFKADLFDPDEFREIIEASGARYFVFTSKHHEGFTMWPSNTSWNWNSVDVGPKRDIVGQLKEAFSKSKVHFGLYFSLFEWFHPLYLGDTKENTTKYVDQVSYPQLLEIVKTYKPDVIWSDGDWEMSAEYWKSKEFISWLYNESPVKDTVVTNDRWGTGIIGKHGGFFTYEDHYDPGTLLPRKWENCLTLDAYSWGNRRTMKSKDVQTVHYIIEQIARTISCGGNVLLNVGPDMHGKIPVIFEDRLRELGHFINQNSEALYGSKPWAHQNDTNDVWYTSRLRKEIDRGQKVYNPQNQENTIIYAWLLNVNESVVKLSKVKGTNKTKVTILSTGTSLNYLIGTQGEIIIGLDKVPWETIVRTDVLVLKIEYALSDTHNPLKAALKQYAQLEAKRKKRQYFTKTNGSRKH